VFFGAIILNMIKIENKTFDEERSLYASKDAIVNNCRIDGPADGESSLKEARNVKVKNSYFNLRYPFWHDDKLSVDNCELTPLCRAALWYSKNIKISNSKLNGIKALRECSNVEIKDCEINSPEFGWRCKNVSIVNSKLSDVMYLFFETKDIKLKNVQMNGKYTFQYVKNMIIENSYLDTKDAFWHTKNVVVKNSTIKGEYLGWYSDGLTLINCKIIGTQPLCYCKHLKLINCTMEDTDLSFEYSDVEATIKGNVMSIKNPRSGKITVDSVDEIILENSVMKTKCQIIQKKRKH